MFIATFSISSQANPKIELKKLAYAQLKLGLVDGLLLKIYQSPNHRLLRADN